MPTPARRAISSTETSIPSRAKAALAASTMRSRFRSASRRRGRWAVCVLGTRATVAKAEWPLRLAESPVDLYRPPISDQTAPVNRIWRSLLVLAAATLVFGVSLAGAARSSDFRDDFTTLDVHQWYKSSRPFGW